MRKAFKYRLYPKKTSERRQQSLSRKKKGSHRRERAKRLIGKAHRKIRNQRHDFLQKQSKKIVDRYQVIVFEDIRTANLTKKPKPKQDENGNYLPNGAAAKGGLNKSILDAGWGTFVAMCTFKAACAGRTLIKILSGYPPADHGGGRKESRPQAGTLDVSHGMCYTVIHETETSLSVPNLPNG